MALSAYCKKYYGEIDLDSLDCWTIGKWNVHEIYPNAQEYIPCIYRKVLEEEYGMHLPQNHLRFWFENEERFWTCKHCGFWCDFFDHLDSMRSKIDFEKISYQSI